MSAPEGPPAPPALSPSPSCACRASPGAPPLSSSAHRAWKVDEAQAGPGAPCREVPCCVGASGGPLVWRWQGRQRLPYMGISGGLGGHGRRGGRRDGGHGGGRGGGGGSHGACETRGQRDGNGAGVPGGPGLRRSTAGPTWCGSSWRRGGSSPRRAPPVWSTGRRPAAAAAAARPPLRLRSSPQGSRSAGGPASGSCRGLCVAAPHCFLPFGSLCSALLVTGLFSLLLWVGEQPGNVGAASLGCSCQLRGGPATVNSGEAQ